MKIIEQSYEVMSMADYSFMLEQIEIAGRTCYKSEDKITMDSAEKFVRGLIKSGHHSVLEHQSITVKFITDRAVLAELTRHRLASFSVESQRFCNYGQDKFSGAVTFIKPVFWAEESENYNIWVSAMQSAEQYYFSLLKSGAKPEQARAVLPNSTKTEIVMTCNLREWRHVLNLRCSPAAYSQIRELMLPLLKNFANEMPAFFSDILEKYNG